MARPRAAPAPIIITAPDAVTAVTAPLSPASLAAMGLGDGMAEGAGEARLQQPAFLVARYLTEQVSGGHPGVPSDTQNVVPRPASVAPKAVADASQPPAALAVPDKATTAGGAGDGAGDEATWTSPDGQAAAEQQQGVTSDASPITSPSRLRFKPLTINTADLVPPAYLGTITPLGTTVISPPNSNTTSPPGAAAAMMSQPQLPGLPNPAAEEGPVHPANNQQESAPAWAAPAAAAAETAAAGSRVPEPASAEPGADGPRAPAAVSGGQAPRLQQPHPPRTALSPGVRRAMSRGSRASRSSRSRRWVGPHCGSCAPMYLLWLPC